MSELAIQLAFRRRARMMCPRVRIVAIPNGTHIASRAGRAKANAEGRSAGFPDVQCLWPGGGFAAIEFKAPKGRVSENQSEWLDWLTESGFACTVSRDADHALEWLRSLGAPFIDRVGVL